VGRAADSSGAAHLVMAQGGVHLDPATAVFEGMLEGWARQQRTRFLKWDSTIKPRMSLVRRLAKFSNQYPWEWQPAEVEAFFDNVRANNPNFTVSTARQYQNSLRMFCDFICDARYGWLATCQDRFGQVPVQILHEHNSIAHVSEFEGQPGRRPLTYEEVQALFDAADGRVEQIRARRRKGTLSTMRDSALLKTYYAFAARKDAGWTSPIYGATRRHHNTAGMGRCSCAGVNHPTAAHPNAERCSPCRRWTGSSTCSTII
jgi:integrase/recombinase XerD